TAAAACLDVAAALLAFEATLLRGVCRPGRPPWFWALHRRAQQLDKPLDRVRAIALLRAEALRLDHDDAVLGHALAGQALEANRRIGWQRDAAGVEAELRRRRHLVDVLAAGAGRANESDLDVVLVDQEVTHNPQHGRTGWSVGIGARNIA